VRPSFVKVRRSRRKVKPPLSETTEARKWVMEKRECRPDGETLSPGDPKPPADDKFPGGPEGRRKVMRKLATLIGVAVLVVAFGVVTTTPAIAKPKRKFGRLKAPKDGIWLIDHYDNRTGQVTGGPAFDDSAETIFRGRIGGVGRATVKQSAAWTFTTFAAAGAGPCALVYDSTNPRTLVRIHTHQGVSTENVSGPLTLIDGSAVNDPGGITEFPFAADGKGADFGTSGLNVGTHTFTGIIKITKKSGATINGIILGGTNCEVKVFTTEGGHPPAGVFDFTHSDTHNTVTTVFKITGGTKRFSGLKGDGVLVYTYDTFEPHTLLDAHITIFKFK